MGQLIQGSLSEGAIGKTSFNCEKLFVDGFCIILNLISFTYTACSKNSSSQSQQFAPDIQTAIYSGNLQKRHEGTNCFSSKWSDRVCIHHRNEAK